MRFEICYYYFSHEENKSNHVSLNFCTIRSSYQYEKATPSEIGIFTHRHCEALLLCLIAQWLWDSMWLCPRGSSQSPTVSALSHSDCLWHSKISSADDATTLCHPDEISPPDWCKMERMKSVFTRILLVSLHTLCS